MKWVPNGQNWYMQCPRCKSAQLCGEHDNSMTVKCPYPHEMPMVVPALPAEGEHGRGKDGS